MPRWNEHETQGARLGVTSVHPRPHLPPRHPPSCHSTVSSSVTSDHDSGSIGVSRSDNGKAYLQWPLCAEVWAFGAFGACTSNNLGASTHFARCSNTCVHSCADANEAGRRVRPDVHGVLHVRDKAAQQRVAEIRHARHGVGRGVIARRIARRKPPFKALFFFLPGCTRRRVDPEYTRRRSHGEQTSS